MFPFNKDKTAKLNVMHLTFLGEQDGLPERELKNKLSSYFLTCQTVLKAFLARVHYGNPNETHIALCIRQSSTPDKLIHIEAGNIFSSIFGKHEHLDIMNISTDQESQIKTVCNPFYVQKPVIHS